MTTDRRLLRQLSDAVAAGTPVVVATVIATKRSVPRRAGAKMLVFGDRTITGTIGGGMMESQVIDEAVDVLRSGIPKLVDYELIEPGRGDPGVCGGEVRIYLEPHMPPATVFVVGAGHVGKAVVDLAHWLGYRTVVTDDREDQLDEGATANADVVLKGSIGEAAAAFEITESTAIVIVSRNVDIDVEAVSRLVESPAAYLGVMGSVRRWNIVRERLISEGVDEAALERIRVPIGIELGAETVEEIAVSILSEVIKDHRLGIEED